jgi:hypothetical protein
MGCSVVDFLKRDQGMIVYQLRQNSERFCSFAANVGTDHAIYHRFDGTPLKASWEELAIHAADEPDERAQLPDFALLGVVPVFSEQAVNALRDLLELNGELLSLRHARRKYFAYNVTTMLDALDEGRSRVSRFSDGGIMSIEGYVFRPGVLSDAAIFKIPQLPGAFVYVTEEFADRVRRAELLGFVFRELWREAGAT